MNLPISEIKRPLYWGLTWIFTFINFIIFTVSRNEFWLTHPGQAWLASSDTEDRTYIASEFERNLSCYAPLTCLRSGGAFLSQGLIKLSTTLSEVTRIDLTIDQKIFIIMIVGLAWRILCIGILIVAIVKLFNSLQIGLLLGNGLLFLLSGLPLWRLGRILVGLPFGLSESTINRANEAFVHMAFGDLVFYDFGFFALIPLTALALSKISNVRAIRLWQYFITGFLIASFYEAFVPIVLLATIVFVWISENKIVFKAFMLLTGQVTWTLLRAFSVRFTEASDPNSIYFFETTLINVIKSFRSTVSNLSSPFGSIFSVAIQLILISALALLVGFVIAQISIYTKRPSQIVAKTSNAILSTTVSVVGTITLSFLRPIYVETGRQSLGMSIALVIFAFSYTQRYLIRRQTSTT